MIWRWTKLILPPFVVLVLLALAAQWYVTKKEIPLFLFPKPTDIYHAFKENWLTLKIAGYHTALGALIGFAASAVIGTLLAIAFTSSRWVERAFYPYTVFFQTVPIIAIAPMLILWLEAGMKAVAVCAFIASVFPIITNMMTGLHSIDPALRDLFKLYGGGPIARLFKLRIPSSLPYLFTGLRIAAGLSVIGTIVGEFVATELDSEAGLGIMILAATKYGQTDLVFAGVIAASVLGIAMLVAINIVGHLLLRRWHASEQ